MKTLLISEVFPPQTGGSGRWFWEIYRRLPRKQVVVAAGDYSGAEVFDRGHDVNIVRLPLAMSRWGLRTLPEIKDYWRRFRQLQRIVRSERVESIHAGRVLPEGWLAWMLHKWCGLPYLVYVHGEELAFGEQSRELGWMMRQVFGRAERVIVNSRNSARLMHDGWNVPPAKLTVLHPGVDTERFLPAARDSTVRRRLGWFDRPVILTVGRLQKRKGHDMLLRALPQIRESVPDVLYAIIGDGGERRVLETSARQLGVEDSVVLLGEADDELMIACYQQCQLFVLPNREVGGDIEGFGMVLLEAQACGKPVIAGDSGGTAETMQQGITGEIVDCTSPAPLAEAVVRMLSDNEHLESMGVAAREWAVERFDWSSLAVEAATLFGLAVPKTSTSVERDRTVPACGSSR